MSESIHKEPGYNHGHTMKPNVDPDAYSSTPLSYRSVSRIVNVLEDLHYQCQRPEGERFKNYPIDKYEDLDTTIRDNLANLALSIEVRAASEGSGK